MSGEMRGERITHALVTVRALLADSALHGIVLTRPGSVAWASGGMNPSIDRTAAVDTVWMCIGVDRAVIVTTEVEEPRIIADMNPAAYGISTVSVPWWDPDAAVVAAARVFGTDAGIGSDGHPGFEVDVTDAITAVRIELCPAERDELRALGREATEAVQTTLREWVPGETDLTIQSRIVQAVEAKGGDCPVVIVGADERVTRFRHPVAIGASAHHTVMAVLVARRSGLHVALTRFASAGPIEAGLAEGLARSRRVHRSVLAATVPGRTYGSVLETLDAAYAEEGRPEEWQRHYQGGPIGFAQREFEIAPSQRESRWWDRRIVSGSAVAWNPSFPGGGKDEDTYLVGDGGVAECVTVAPAWPSADENSPERPGVLITGRREG